MLGRSLKDSSTQFTVLESQNGLGWEGSSSSALSMARETFPRLLQEDTRDDLQLENLFVFFPTQNNPILSASVPSQAAQSRESSVTAGTSTATPHVTSPHSCSQRAGDRLGASPCWVTFPAGNGLGRTHLFPPQAPGQCCVQGSCRIFPLILNRC